VSSRQPYTFAFSIGVGSGIPLMFRVGRKLKARGVKFGESDTSRIDARQRCSNLSGADRNISISTSSCHRFIGASFVDRMGVDGTRARVKRFALNAKSLVVRFFFTRV
jgi:hypothetical protein